MISLVFPTYNEAENIGKTISAIRALNIPDLEIIVCDDHSPDGTAEAAKKADPETNVLLHEGPRGLSASVVYGFERAKGDLLICMDADGQHRPEDLPAVIQDALTSGFAVGSRFVPGGGFQERWSAFRLFVSRASALLAKIFLGTKLHDPMSGFFAVRKEIFLSTLPYLNQGGFKIMLEMASIATALNKDLQIRETPIRFALRHAGESKTSARIAFQYLVMLFACRKVRKKLLKENR